MNIMIISGWADGSLRGHNSVDGAEIFEVVDAHHGGVTCVAAAPLYIVTGGEDSTVRGSVWAVCGEEREEEEARARARRSARNMISLSRVHTLSFFLSLSLLSAALSLLFSLRLRYTMQVRLWRNSGGRDMLCAFHDHRAKITCVVADRHHDHIVHTHGAPPHPQQTTPRHPHSTSDHRHRLRRHLRHPHVQNDLVPRSPNGPPQQISQIPPG